MNHRIKGHSLLFLFIILTFTDGYSQKSSKKDNLRTANFISLDLKVLTKGNQVDSDGLIRKFKAPVVHLYRTKVKLPKGTILLLSGGGNTVLSAIAEGDNTALFLNSTGFDIALLEYHIASGPQTSDFLAQPQ